ncbi:MAG: hypothetical protein D6705_04515 [Deltaproteobacteria bacterium]|nr:MAG: hypothetical protein D6705_04515 [Deltaproteobacteria bacterium]
MHHGYDELAVCGLTLRGAAQGGIRTCLMVPELDLMFDCGPVDRGTLRFDRILVSHGHQDHLGYLPYLVSQRQLMRKAPPDVHLPEEVVGPLRRIFDAWAEIEDFDLAVGLHGHAPEDTVDLGKGRVARAIRSDHRVPSLCWLVERHTRKLRSEFAGMPGPRLRELKERGVEITRPHVEPLLAVTGDTRIDLFVRDERLQQVKVLVHEVTAWDDRRSVEEMRAWGHTHVDEFVQVADRFRGEALVLVHRSLRHSKADAEAIVQERFPASVRDRVHVFGT